MKCRYGNTGRTDQVPCQRDAVTGWTTCARHHSAGISRKVWERYQEDRRARPAQYRPIEDEREDNPMIRTFRVSIDVVVEDDHSGDPENEDLIIRAAEEAARIAMADENDVMVEEVFV